MIIVNNFSFTFLTNSDTNSSESKVRVGEKADTTITGPEHGKRRKKPIIASRL